MRPLELDCAVSQCFCFRHAENAALELKTLGHSPKEWCRSRRPSSYFNHAEEAVLEL